VALNLVGVEHRELARGDALVRARQWTRATTVDVRVQRVPGEKVARRGRVQVYVGSGEHGAGLRVLDPDGTFARLRFDEPLTLAPGDRVVIRDPGRERTVAGAEVLDAEARGRCRRRPGPSRAPARRAARARAPMGRGQRRAETRRSGEPRGRRVRRRRRGVGRSGARR
jgi:selenocysteine-specific elongation factor